MRIRGLKLALALSCGLLAVAARAATAEKPAPKPFADADHVIYIPLRGDSRALLKAALLTNHGGGVIASPKVVLVFWGPSFNNAASPDYAYARTLQAYRNQLGSTAEWSALQEYGIMFPVNLGSGTADWFDTSTPPTNVTDAIVRAEVNRYLSTHAFNNSTVYEVVTPSTSYSSSGSSTSCGGPSLAYCAYHGSYTASLGTVKYSIQPYPSCSGCKVSGWSDVQNQEHFVFHETCNAVTNPVNGWYDSSGNEVCDKCAWSPTPFLDGGYGYQYIWSNRTAGCVRTR
ncbi:MAG TPA: hypothetical protein VGM86_00485 [Thermoanaerobaculia bacterium]|jgi:hypothetical protein